MTDFTALYRSMADEEVMQLYADRSGLTPEARDAVTLEFNNRKLSEEDASKLKREMLEYQADAARKQGAVTRLVFGGWFRWFKP